MNRTSVDLLRHLVAFPTVSSSSNLDLAGWIETFLTDLGFTCQRCPSPDGTKVGLLARIGPEGEGGTVLSAHMDVVPVTGQNWSHDPFDLIQRDGRAYGRGACDMKGFLACCLTAARRAATSPLKRPFLLSLSYDEELGCLGIAAMMDQVIPFLGRADLCIVGEPTSLQITTGHKGKIALRADCFGLPGHSAEAPLFVNALQLASRFVVMLDHLQRDLHARGPVDQGYGVGYCTVHAGKMSGGVALNMVPERASVDFELRYLPEVDENTILAEIQDRAAAICAHFNHPAARIEITERFRYPGFAVPEDAAVVAKMRALLPGAGLMKVAYGTEAGFFAGAGIPTIVCGPGSMDQGHQPDEFIAQDQLDQCDALLARVVDGLCG